jgi:hypothetical protein
MITEIGYDHLCPKEEENFSVKIMPLFRDG